MNTLDCILVVRTVVMCALFGAACCSTAVAQWDCPSMGCAPYDPGELDISWSCDESTAKVAPDRRPVKYISMIGGPDPDATPYVRAAWNNCGDTDPANGVEDAFDWLIGQLDTFYAEGWRRFVIFYPATQWGPANPTPSSQYWTMPEWMRDGFTNYISVNGDGMTPGWFGAHSDATLGIYGGFRIHDPCDLCNDPEHPDCPPTTVPHRVPDCMEPNDALVVFNNIHPWMSIVGVSEYWFDKSSNHSDGSTSAYLKLITASLYQSIHFGMEAIPVNPADLLEPNLSALAITPAVAGHNVLRQKNGVGIGAPMMITTDWDFSADMATTEVGVLLDQQFFQGMNAWYVTRDRIMTLVGLYKSKGYVIWAGADPTTGWAIEEAVKRHHWPGQWPGTLGSLNLSCPEDLNMDGSVNSADLAILVGNWGNGGKTLADGDLTGDGNVTAADQSQVLGAWGACP